MSANTGKGSRVYGMVAGRGHGRPGFDDLDERVLVRPWTDAGGGRRGTDPVGLGANSDLAGAIRPAEAGLERHPEGSMAHRGDRNRLDRLPAARGREREVDVRHRAPNAAPAGDVPAYGDPVAVAAG